MTGTWVGNFTHTDSSNSCTGQTKTESLTFDLTQSGTSLSGTANGATLTGTVDSASHCTIVGTPPCGGQVTFACDVTSTSMSCSATGTVCYGCSSGSSDGTSMTIFDISSASATFTKQ